MEDKLFLIGHISEFCKVSVKTLRYYDDIDLVKPVYVNPITRYRYYSPEQTEIIFLIKILRELGFAISQIKSVLRHLGLDGLVSLFASFLYTGKYESLRKEGYTHLYSWIETNSYTPQGLSIEIYHITRPVSRIVGDFVTEIQVPVKKRGGSL